MTPRKEKALHALLTTVSLTNAALKAGISQKTLYNYLHKDEDFKQCYNAEMNKIVSDAAQALQKAMIPAIETLHKMVANEEKPDQPKIQACRSVLDYGLRYIEISDILQRLSALERSERM